VSESGAIGLELREVRAADLDAFFAHQRDGESALLAAFTAPDRDDRAAFDARWGRLRSDETVRVRTIVVAGAAAGEVAGHVASFGPPDEREVTYWIDRALWGRGVASLALARFLATVERERPTFARAAADNAASLRVLARCGFVELRRERGFANARGAEIDELVLVLR